MGKFRYNRTTSPIGEKFNVFVDGVKVGTIARNAAGSWTVDLPNHNKSKVKPHLALAQEWVENYFNTTD